ncbi:MAG: dihydropteroate synthase [Thermoplasmata archaeon]|nr:dihydropteroate synthase [Thermoplasmata archaeon]
MLSASSLRRNGSRPRVMGILNVTPDSFSDGGRYVSAEDAVRHAFEMIDEGADIIDIGGESTRPGASPVSEKEELARIVPVLKELVPRIGVPVSVDTMKASVARECIGLGASIINDVSSLSDPGMAPAAAELGVPLVLMSSYGNPSTFRTNFIPGDAVEYACGRLQFLIGTAHDAGVGDDMIIIDPGAGFGTDDIQAMDLLRNSSRFSFGRYPVLVGPSRKRFLRHWYPEMDPDSATDEACRAAVSGGADILRVHAPGRLKGLF